MEEKLDVVVDSSSAKRGIDVLTTAMNALIGATKGAEAATTRLMNMMTSGLTKLEAAFFSLKSVLLGFAAVIGIFNHLTSEITRFQAFISAMGVSAGGVKAAREEFSFLMNMADRLGISINSLSHNYSQMAAAATSSGMTLTQLRDIFESFSVAARVMHLSNQDTRLMFYSLTQMVSKGVVSMEELRRQLGEKLPGAMNIAAKSLNTTMPELEKAIRKGIVDSAKFLPIFADAVRATFSPGLVNATQAFDAEVNRLSNNLQKMVIIFYDLGVADSFTNIIKELNRILSDKEIAEEFAKALKSIADGVTTFLKSITGETVRKFIGDFTAALKLMAKTITEDVLPIIMKLAEWIGKIAAGWLILKGITLGGAAGTAIGGPGVGTAIGAGVGGAAAISAVVGINNAMNPEQPDWTGSAGNGQRDKLNDWSVSVGNGFRTRDNEMNALAAAWEGMAAQTKGENDRLGKSLKDVIGEPVVKSKETRELSVGAVKEEEMFEEARRLGREFQLKEAEQFKKFTQLDQFRPFKEELTPSDMRAVGGAEMIKFEEERTAQLIKQYDEQQDMAIKQGAELLAGDELSHSLRLSALKNTISHGEETQRVAYEEQLRILNSFSNEELDDLGGYYSIKEQMDREHMDRIHAARLQSGSAILAMMKAFRDQDYKNAFGTMAAITANLATNSRKWFEINKAAGVAHVAIEGVQAVISAYKWGTTWGGPYGGAAMAAIASAFYASQAAAIMQTSFGGGRGSAPSLAGSPGIPVTPVMDQTTQSASQTVIEINIDGNIVGNEAFVNDTLIPALRDAIDNRDVVVISPNSRQAAELAGI